MDVTPVLLCGGSGTRLWPVSRKAFPKQFGRLVGDASLFTAAAQRMQALGLQRPLAVGGDEYRFLIAEQLQAAGIDPQAILIEPSARNTAPAILAAALYAAKTDPAALLLVAPSDHLINDEQAFGAAVTRGVEAAQSGALVTFGIAPTRAETGYGYLQLEKPSEDGEAVPLSRFVEKPDSATAQRLLASDDHLWNAGIFLFRADALIKAFEHYAPDMLVPVQAAVADAQADLGFLRLAGEPWARAESISIDYAIMEKADNLMVVPYAGHWSDLGDWDSIWREGGPQDDGVVTTGAATALSCTNSYLRSESDGIEVVGIGLKDTLVVATSDAVLVADKSRAQDVKLAVDRLREKKAKQAESFPRDNRPWGWYETLALSDRFQVKRIVVKPGAALSLQSHMHRSEHWIVVSGTAKVTVDADIRLISENESVYIPLGAKHRLENPGKLPMVLIEVQTGAYLGEDDITRYEDVYARS
ncbi:MAG: mannose-1-phosphate guanylyltransferase/mannose-6-phosphate isomerase [Devosiaceae bacterium]